MAKDNKIEVQIEAKDEASAKLDQVADKAEKLEAANPVEVHIGAEGDEQVQSTLADVLAMTQRLGTEDAQIVLAIQAAEVQNQLASVLADIALVNGTPIEIEAKIERANELRSEFDQITEAITDLAAKEIQIKIDADVDAARQSLERALGSVDELRDALRSDLELDLKSADFEGKMDRALENIGEFSDRVRAVADEAVDITVSTKVDTTGIEDMRAQLRLLSDDYREIASSLAAMQERRGGDLIHDDDIADAERLSAALQNAAETGEAVGIRGGAGLDEFGKKAGSATSASSVLANTVGNAAQDMGQLAGISGTAGVALGQLGEYMDDARAKGEPLSQVVTNFAGVVGPIAAISVGVGLATKAWSDYKAKQKEIQQATKETTEGLLETLDVVDDITEKFDKAATAYEGFSDVLLEDADDRDKVIGFLADLNLTLEDLPGLIEAIQTGDTTAIGDLIKQLGGSDEAAEGVAELVREGFNLSKLNSNADLLAWVQSLDQDSQNAILSISGLADEINGLQPNEAAGVVIDQIATSSPAARDAIAEVKAAMPDADNVAILNAYVTGLDQGATAAERWAMANKPMEDMPETWKAAANGAARLVAGQQLTARQQQAVNVLMGQYGMTTEQVLNKAYDLWLKNHEVTEQYSLTAEEAAQNTADFVDEINAIVKAAADSTVALTNTNEALKDLSEQQDEMREKSLAEALDLGDTPLDTLASIHDIHEGFRQLGEFLNDPKGLAGRVPDIFDPKDVEAGPFISKLRQLAGPIQEQVARAFGEGGISAASALAQQFISSLASESGLDPSVVSTMLGLDNLQASIEISIKQTADATARSMLDLLVSLQGGHDVFSAELLMGLNAGTITPEQVTTRIEQRLGNDFKITVPTSLADIDSDQEIADLQRGVDATGGVTVPLRFISDRGQDAAFRNAAPPSVINNTVNMPPQPPGTTYDNNLSFIELNGDRTAAG